jgi:hypothetical protein
MSLWTLAAYMKKILLLFAVLSSSAYPNSRLSHQAIYQRCFSLFFERYPGIDDVLLKKILSKNITGVEACDQLIDELTFDENGKIKKSQYYSQIDLIHALSLIQKLHTSWFNSYDFTFTEKNWGSLEIYDLGQPALYFTNAFFGNIPLKNLLKGHDQPYALRSFKKAPTSLIYKRGSKNISYDKIHLNYKDEDAPAVPMAPLDWVARGQLIGVTTKQRHYIVERAYRDLMTGFDKVTQDIFQSYGGGLLGTPVYIMLNQGQAISAILDGELKTYRRWSKAVLSDLLCRTLPVVKEEDSLGSSDPKSKTAFKKNNSCYVCHHTMDPMAGLIRNISTFINNSNGVTFDEDGALVLEKDKHDLQFTYLRDLVKNPLKYKFSAYMHSAPSGKFNFRDLDGKLIEKQLETLDQLGEVLAETPDYYSCIARRYLKFSTGVDIETDPNLQSKDPLSKSSQLHLKLLNELAKRLKAGQDIKKLLKDIFRTSLYSEQFYRL